ncbi:MAG: CHAT domain-containing protein [Actinomycetia bacterium]|nr:CHAT domain-containing protein [Actinomycetes bacterium]MCP4960518.1 CHAT domain-containing protein [Actinomycetes bacterium]
MTTAGSSASEIIDQAEPLVQSDPAAARRLMDAAHRAFVADDTAALRARHHYLDARLCVNEGRLQDALEHIGSARQLWLSEGETMSALRTDLGRMHVLDDLGQHRQSVAVGQHLLVHVDALVQSMPDEELRDEATWLRAAAGENLAVAHGYLADHHAALTAHRETEAAYRALGMPDDIARSMANQGVELLELGRLDEAGEILDRAIVHFARVDDRVSQGQALAYRARAELKGGHLVEAHETLNEGLECLDGIERSPVWAQAQLELADLYIALGLIHEAAQVQTDVLESGHRESLRREMVLASFGRGMARLVAGDLDGAERDLHAAADGYVEIGDAVGQARALVGISRTKTGIDALVSARHALALLDDTHPVELTETLIRVAECDFHLEVAKASLARARDLAGCLSMPHLDWQIHYCAGQLARRSGDVRTALAEYEAAHLITKDQRLKLTFETHRMSFLTARSHVVNDLLSLVLELGDEDRAFELMAEERARTLAERIEGKLGAATTSSPPELSEIYNSMLGADEELAIDLRSRARAIEDLGSSPAPVFSMSETAGRGSEGSEVVYQSVDGVLFAFAHVDNEVRSVRLGNTSEIDRQLGRLSALRRRSHHRTLTTRHSEQTNATVDDVLQQLHKSLIAPLGSLFDGTLPDDLTVVPQGSLMAVPFAGLTDGRHAVVDETNISVSPGIGWTGNLSARIRSLDSSLVVGVDDELAPYMSAEASLVASVAPNPTLLAGEDATADNVARLMGEHGLVHLACHGLFRSDNPFFSALRLADRWMTAAEMSRVPLDGQLVVLSSCSSGRQGQVGSENELLGFPHALLAAGAAAVVVNTWEADDEASTALMYAFHRTLNDGLPAAAALARAQRTIRSTHPDIRMWANPILIGAREHRMESI